MSFGFSRDDIGTFLSEYLERKILPEDPFQSIDQSGVGQLVQYSCERGRSVRPKLEIGVCGEHGGDPASIEFFYETGLNYVSCSPFRVPIARLAVAQAEIRAKKTKAPAKKATTKKAPAKKAVAKKTK
jgi:pyruvate,orthophosphate dikinase